MMGAGGFIKNPGWDMYSIDAIDEDDLFYEVNSDLEIDPELLVYFPPWSDDEAYTDEEADDQDDPDYFNSDSSDSTADLDDDEELDNSMEEDVIDQDIDDDFAISEDDQDDEAEASSPERLRRLSDMEEGEESENDST